MNFWHATQGDMLVALRSLRGDLEVAADTIRRMDGSFQGQVGEIRAVTAQTSRLRPRLDRIEERR